MQRGMRRLTVIVVPWTGRRRTISFQIAPMAAAVVLLLLVGTLAAWVGYAHTASRTVRGELEALRELSQRQQAEIAAINQTAAEAQQKLLELQQLQAELEGLTQAERSARGAVAPFLSQVSRGALQVQRHLAARLPADLTDVRASLEQDLEKLTRLQALLEVKREELAQAQAYRMHRPTGSPVTGATITDRFGWRLHPVGGGTDYHEGLDLAQEEGAPVTATGAGTVTYAGWDDGGLGNTVRVDHGYGFTTVYGHLSSIAVEEGQSVARGTIIGSVGSTGVSTGPHLHYEVHMNGQPVDPANFLGAGG